MKHAELVFGIITFLLIISVVIILPDGTIESQVIRKPVIPYIDLISPDKEAVSYNLVQTFLYKVENVDYNVFCTLIVNEDRLASQEISPNELGEFKQDIDLGYHKWSIGCRLLNSRTISSPPRSLLVEHPTELGRSFEKITGDVIDVPEPTGYKGIIVALLGLALLVWAVNARRSS